ncbi:iron complex outermembrane receptor protein [Novosphingobium sp. SG751A]|uniref:TonB-dependent receptor n=1 Tax=Novosphingobium sp. SG751A TaxID=2587000 RepID=UPI0015535DFB|nr:TonB-dependent receptor [Novosphingobium sp. SG751A]NOW48441.1 iron complex outermembrane receptor protein [Novosphingobium sp. SG751A]
MKTKSRTLFVTCSVAALSLAPMGAAALAQTVPDAGEIVVTAQKRSENVQKVPVAVSVLNPAAIGASGAQNLQDLAKASSSLTITPESQPANTSIILRGVGTFAFSIAVEPAVAVIVDDVPQAYQAQALTSDLGDVERVEVLRGPQSTLFGKSASAGVINVVSKGPSDTFTLSGQATATTDQEYRVGLTAAGPITKNLSYRVTGATSTWAGPSVNLTTGDRINGLTNSTLKGVLRWNASDALTLTGGIVYNRVKSNCCSASYIQVDPNAKLLGTSFTGAQVTAGETVNRSNNTVRLDSPLFANSQFIEEFGKIGYTLDSGLSLLSVTSHQLFKLYSGVDNDFSDLPVATANNGGVSAPNYIQTVNNRVETWTQELRLTSPDTGPLKYVAGLYFQSYDGGGHFRRGPTYNIGSYDAYATSKNYAIFGQATWDFAPGSRVIAGLRANSEDIGYRFFKNTTSQYFSGKNKDNVITGKFGLQHDLARDVMVFATYVRGYKGQAYDLTSALNPVIAANFPIKAEHSNDYEIGLRSQFLNRRITLNLTGFWTDYNNFQAQGLLPDIAATPVLANVGQVRTRGIELESSARISDALRLNAGITFTDAKIVRYPNGACYPGQTAATGCVGNQQNEAGNVLPNAPRWKMDLGGEYRLPISEDLKAAVTAHYTWQSKVNYALTGDPSTVQGAYGIFNLGISLSPKDDRFKITAFVNNLFDQQYYTRIDNRASLWGGATTLAGYLPRDFQRYAGVTLGFKY